MHLARTARAGGISHMEFMLHSSEFMPGGSPDFSSAADIEQLYETLEMLFEELATWCRGRTLKEFHAQGLQENKAAGALPGQRHSVAQLDSVT